MMEKHAARSRYGFTLVEIAVVVTIIGLLLGGVLVGRDLIHAAEIRRTVNQIETYNSAVIAFRTKYGCLPGDCRTASAFGFDPVSNGNGDGKIGLCNSLPGCLWGTDGANLGPVGKETVNFWYHLAATQLVDNTVQPASAVSPGGSPPLPNIHQALGVPGWGVQAEPAFCDTVPSMSGQEPCAAQWSGHAYILAHLWWQPSVNSYAAYRVTDIAAIDVKIDDGYPMSGNAHAYGQAGITYTPAQPGGPFGGGYFTSIFTTGPSGGAHNCICNDTTPYTYNAGSNALCGLAIKAAF